MSSSGSWTGGSGGPGGTGGVSSGGGGAGGGIGGGRNDAGGRARLSAVARAMRVREPNDADQAWRALEARLQNGRRARTRRAWLALPTFTLAAAGALIVAMSVRGGSERAAEQAIEVGRPFESADAEVALALPEGIQVDLDRRSRVRLESVAPEEVRVALNKGSARFDVEPHRPRRVVVNAGDVEVRVLGTRFRVTRIEAADAEDEARIEVAVERGVVEVRDRRHTGEPHRLRAGERFSMPAVSTGAEPGGGNVQNQGDDRGDDGAQDTVSTGSGAALTADQPSDEPVVRLASATRAASQTEISSSIATAGRSAAATSARALLERAQIAWRAGRMHEAAADYAEMLDRHPSDRRAALAAFELGRIQMDHLSDLRAATTSFERALHLSPRASFQEDTLARLAQANDQLGRRDDCRRARQTYLREYPNGLHVARVSDLCQ